MLTAPNLKEAANADEDEDEDVAQSDRLQDEPAETETELLSSFTPLPAPSLPLWQEKGSDSVFNCSTLAAFALISLPQRELR